MTGFAVDVVQFVVHQLANLRGRQGAGHCRPKRIADVGIDLFVGLCVWGRGQLEAEVERAAWLLGQATVETLFSAHPEDLWADLVAHTQPMAP